MRRAEKGKRPVASPDPQEEAALQRAAEALLEFRPGLSDPKILAYVAISAWIVSRTAQSARIRFGELAFDLNDARLRGFIEGALPRIGEALAHIPADAPLFELTRDQVVDVFLAGIAATQEAAVAANESLGFPFCDEVPF